MIPSTNVAQIMISHQVVHAGGAVSMPAFGGADSNEEISAVANYVTSRFGAKGSSLRR